jgi:signal transduction histidine kinase
MRYEGPSGWTTGVAVVVLMTALFHHVPDAPGDTLRVLHYFISPIMLAGAAVLWSRGVRDAGCGWRRLTFLAAFSGSIVSVAQGSADFLGGFWAGLTAQSPEAAGTRSPLPQLVVWVALSVVLGMILDRLERHRNAALAQARAADEARDQELRARLAPHFIFNTLNTLHAQIDHDSEAAKATAEKLAALLRRVIDVSRRRTIPLGEELEFVEAYLGLERARLGARLTVRIEIPEELETLEIPPLSLQVLVENAVKHGVAPFEGAGTVVVGAERVNQDTVRLWVLDPGTGVSQRRGSGTALDVLRQRLARPDALRMERVPEGHRVSFLWQHARVAEREIS